MSRLWKPSVKNSYIIPDIHGANDLLKQILNKILPLNADDQVIFLGDYIDRHFNSHLILDALIELKQKYCNQIVLLKGNHEQLLLKCLNKDSNKKLSLEDLKCKFSFWKNIGGLETIQGYLNRHQLNDNCEDFPRFKLETIIPKNHLEFLSSLVKYHQTDDYIFIHGGCDPFEELEKQDEDVLLWDRSLLNIALRLKNKGLPLPWKKTIVCGHSFTDDKRPIILDKYLMLDCGSPEQLLCMELNSRKMMMSGQNNQMWWMG